MTITQRKVFEQAKRQARAIPVRKNKRQAVKTLLNHIRTFLARSCQTGS